MERDTGFRSWFQRAIQLSPSIRQADNETENDDSIDDEDDMDDDSVSFNGNIDGARPKVQETHGKKLSSEVNHWSLLLKDNVRFWDCLAMLRTDPGLACHSAIYLVTQSPDSEYFSEDLRASYSKFFKDEEELEIEVLRLTVENKKLHAVLWVLADNPHFRVDSVVAAIFRLNDTQFEEKFQFVYQPGCFSGKSPVLGPGTKVFDQGGAGIALHTKRCRSSTPVRTCRPLHHISERLCHSVTRNSGYRRGKNKSSNKSKCPIHKYEAPRKRRSDWMKSALLTGLDNNKSSNNKLSKYYESDDEEDNGGKYEDEEEVEEDNDGVSVCGVKRVAEEQVDNREDCDDRSHDIDNANHYERKFESSESSSSTLRPDHSPSRRDLIRSGSTMEPVTKRNLSRSRTLGDTSFWKHNSSNNNNAILHYIDNCLQNSRTGSRELPRVSSGSGGLGKATKTPVNKSNLRQSSNLSFSKTYQKRKPTISMSMSSLGSQTSGHSRTTRRSTNRNSVQFQQLLPVLATSTPKINHSTTPKKVENRSTPYPISISNTPADYISRQNRNMAIMVNTNRKTDIKFCPKLETTKITWQRIPSKGNLQGQLPDLDKMAQSEKRGGSEQSDQSMIPEGYALRSAHWKSSHNDRKTTEEPVLNAVAGEKTVVENDHTELELFSKTGLAPEKQKDITVKSEETKSSSRHSVQRLALNLKGLPNWAPSKNRCECLKETLRKLGPSQYRKPLQTMINRSCSGSIQPGTQLTMINGLCKNKQN